MGIEPLGHFVALKGMKQLITKFMAVVVLGFALMTAAPIGAIADDPVGIPLGQDDKSLLTKLEAYLATIKQVRARFLQVSSTGGVAEGLFELSRPGKMRIIYDEPLPVEIYADGTWMYYHDKELKQVTSSPLSWTPAAPLLAEDIKLMGGDYVVTGLNKTADAIIVSLVDEEEPATGTLTLVFANKPLALKRWSVTDAQGIVTSVTLMAPDFEPTFAKGLFSFTDPYPGVLERGY